MPDDGKQVVMVNLSQDEPVWFLAISDYAKVMRSVIPEYQAKRFLRLIDMFVGASSGTSSGGSTIGSLGLVHGTFRYAQDAEAGVIVLFRKSRVEDDFPGDLDPASSFDVEASLVYHIKSAFESHPIPHSQLCIDGHIGKRHDSQRPSSSSPGRWKQRFRRCALPRISVRYTIVELRRRARFIVIVRSVTLIMFAMAMIAAAREHP